MRIAVLCNDTRGGIQPYAALGMGLQRAGHDVRVVAPAEFAPMFAAAGLRLAPISGGSEAEMRAATKIAGRGTLAAMRLMAKEVPRRIQTATRETLSACEGAEVLTGGIGGMVAGRSVAEKLGVPFVETHLQPVGAPTTEYPGVMLAGVPRWLGGWGRLLSHHLSEAAVWLPFRGAMRAARGQVLGLTGKPRAADPRLPVLYGFSRHVVPVPLGKSRPRHVTGYWTLPTPPSWSPPAGLEEFLALGVGPPPIPRARLTRDNLAEALRQATATETMRAKVAALGKRIRAEDGVAAAVAHFARLP